ncbi:MAG TPA: DHA2 family efflux MFS transporter permease subunit [Solirubrobacteraceae bacterium]|nr:DHA2 family efflux MFS transporter permease subunit [Solirubrobacteraceae bacterium]
MAGKISRTGRPLPRTGGSPRLVLIACVLGSAVVFVDSTVVNIALPALRSGLRASLSDQQWVIDAYLLSLGSLVLLGGSLGDLLGRRRVFATGVAGFGLASLGCAIAPSIAVLIGVRAVQGVFGALLVPSSLAIITETFPAGPARGAAIGTWTAATSAAIAFGPPLGGVLIDALSWRAVFAINVPLVLATLVLIRRAVPSFPGQPASLDLLGAGLCAAGLAGPVLGLIDQPTRGWADPLVFGPLTAGAVLLGAFVVHERRETQPMLPLSLFAARDFTIANLATVAIYAGLGALTFLVAIYVQQVAGYSAAKAGLTLMPVTVMLVALSRRFGALAARVGPRPLMGFGPLVAAAGAALFTRLGQHVDYVGELLPAAAVFGPGMSMTVSPLTATVLAAVDPAHAGVASGVNNALARIASLVAIALVGVVVSLRFDDALDKQVDAGRVGVVAHTQIARLEARPLTRASRSSRRLERAAANATVSSFRYGIGAAAISLALGGLIAFAGFSRRPVPGDHGGPGYPSSAETSTAGASSTNADTVSPSA